MSRTSAVQFGEPYSEDMIKRISQLTAKQKAQDARIAILKGVGYLITVLLASYLLIGFISLVEISDGADIAYSPFWHGPWKVVLAHFPH
ncbi:MAG TPA: hypothetical protein VMD74_00245 [Candidatus Methylomirabilis sp.]|nr:hypothetical protein [Candidatus Methylomirabilis sp.]